MDKLPAAVIFILSLILFYSCNTPNKTYTGKRIELDYSHVNELKENSWIKIDDWKFRHVRDQQEAKNIQFSLPTTTVVLDSSKNGKALRSKTSRNLTPLYLSRYFTQINSTSSMSKSHKSTYRFTEPAFASATGKLQISKSDSSTISITTSTEYPAEIKIIDK